MGDGKGIAKADAVARVTAAHVYRDGCLLTMRCVTEVAEGTQEILVDCVAHGADASTMQVSLPRDARLLSVSVARPDEADVAAEVARLTRDAEARLRRAERRKGARESQRAMLLAPHAGADGASPAYGEYVDGLAARLDAIDDELERLGDEVAEAAEALAAVTREADAAAEAMRRGLVSLRIDAPRACACPIEVSVRSSAASWKAIHSIHVDGFDGPLRMGLRAEVRQCTGLDWEGVDLSLGSSSPRWGGRLPRLSPNRVSCADMAPRAHGARMMMAASPAPAAWDPDMLPLDALDGAVGAQAEERGTGVSYDVPGKWTLADGRPLVVDLKVEEIEADYLWWAVPSLGEEVSIVAVPKSQVDPDSVGHEASVYIDGEYCGMVSIPRQAPGEDAVIPLGTDTRTRATYEVVDEKVSRASLLHGRNSRRHAYRLGVTSARADDVSLLLMAQVPVSADNDVTVDVGPLDDAAIDRHTGLLSWEATLPAGGEVTRMVSYEVSWPKDKSLLP